MSEPTILELVDKSLQVTRNICNEEYSAICTKNRIESLKAERACLRKDLVKAIERLLDRSNGRE